MALTVGTDAYDTLANVVQYWTDRGNAEWAALDETAGEILVRKATGYVDRSWDFIGDKATGPQRLKWPRAYAEVEGFALSDTEIPWQIAEAVAEVAEMYRVGTYDMEGIVTDDSAAVSMEKVDVITIQYDTSKRIMGKAIPSHVHDLLKPLTRGTGGLLRA
jgi:hypothetical protein